MIYNVKKDGNAPQDAKVGNWVSTAGGVYEILDGSKYKGMNKEQLAQSGVGYNPSSGLYSRKVTNPNQGMNQSTPTANPSNSGFSAGEFSGYKFKNNNDLKPMFDSYRNQLDARADADYADALEALKTTYLTSYTDATKQRDNITHQYDELLQQNYDDAYEQNAVVSQLASKRGMTNSAQGLAMNVSSFAQSSKRGEGIKREKAKLVNDVNTEMNRLSHTYNISLDTVKRNFNAKKLENMSTAELEYLKMVMQNDDFNAKTYNDLKLAKTDREWKTSEANQEREWKSTEAEKDRAQQMYLAQMSRSGGGGSGGGSSSKSSQSYTRDQQLVAAYVDRLKASGAIDAFTPDQYLEFVNIMLDSDEGIIGYADAKSRIDAIINPPTNTEGTSFYDRFQKYNRAIEASNSVYAYGQGYNPDTKLTNLFDKLPNRRQNIIELAKKPYHRD